MVSLSRRGLAALSLVGLGLSGCGGESPPAAPALADARLRTAIDLATEVAEGARTGELAGMKALLSELAKDALSVVPTSTDGAARAVARPGSGGWEGFVAVRGIQGLGSIGGHMYLELVRRDPKTGELVRDDVFEALADAGGLLSAYEHRFGSPAPGFSTAAESHDDAKAQLTGVTPATQGCLRRVLEAWEPPPYPVDGAVFGGFNSNSFVKHMMRSCDLHAELPGAFWQLVPGD